MLDQCPTLDLLCKETIYQVKFQGISKRRGKAMVNKLSTITYELSLYYR